MQFSRDELSTIKRAIVAYEYCMHYRKFYIDAFTIKHDISNIIKIENILDNYLEEGKDY